MAQRGCCSPSLPHRLTFSTASESRQSPSSSRALRLREEVAQTAHARNSGIERHRSPVCSSIIPQPGFHIRPRFPSPSSFACRRRRLGRGQTFTASDEIDLQAWKCPGIYGIRRFRLDRGGQCSISRINSAAWDEGSRKWTCRAELHPDSSPLLAGSARSSPRPPAQRHPWQELPDQNEMMAERAVVSRDHQNVAQAGEFDC